MEASRHPTTFHHPDKVLIRAQLKDGLGITFSNPTLLRLERKGRFPARFYLTEKLPVWKEAEVLAWLASKRDASTHAPNRATAKATEAKTRKRGEQGVAR